MIFYDTKGSDKIPMNNYVSQILSGQIIKSFIPVLDDYWQIITDLCTINVYTKMHVVFGSTNRAEFNSLSPDMFINKTISHVNLLNDNEPIEIVLNGSEMIVVQPLSDNDDFPERMCLHFNDGRIVVVY